MPHLQFEINKKLKDDERKEFLHKVKRIFCKVMETGSYHVAISLRELSENSLLLGRAMNRDIICIMNLDIRKGRTKEQKRKLAIGYINLINSVFHIKKKNQYITFTEHEGEDFNLYEKCLETWSENDDPLG